MAKGTGGAGRTPLSRTVVVRSGGPAGRAEYDGTISIDREQWAGMSEDTRRFLIAHEMVHQEVEDFVLTNQKEWDLAVDALTIEINRDGRRLFLGGNTRIGEAITDTIASRILGTELPRATSGTWSWADGVIRRAGHNRVRLSNTADELYQQATQRMGQNG